MIAPLVNTANYPTFDASVHGAPLPPLVGVGDRVNSYDGPGVVLSVEPDAFYGAPPRRQGEAVAGQWDGLAYRVRCDNGRTTTFDRSRITRGR